MRYKPNKRAVIIDHVGNYARHGMPDDDREWTLEKRKKLSVKKIEKEQEEKGQTMSRMFLYIFSTAGRAESRVSALRLCIPDSRKNR